MFLRCPACGAQCVSRSFDMLPILTDRRTPAPDREGASRRHRWLSRVGLFLFIFSLLALSGPGRIDIVDGQARYEVARSLVEHGDSVVRNRDVWFGVFPGRDGQPYTDYRFPQSVLGVPAILVADATGPVREERRHFFFVLTSAAAAALLALAYATWFRSQGLSDRRAVQWAGAGILCTPSWFYATSTFDDILGTAAVVAAVVVADAARRSGRWTAAGWAALLIGLAFNCKQPLAVFGLGTAAALDEPGLGPRKRLIRSGLLVLGLGVGVAAYLAYDFYKFPPGTKDAHSALLLQYIPVWPGNFMLALLAIALSPCAGLLWYSPTLLLCLAGMRRPIAGNSRWIQSVLAATAMFSAFILSMSIFKGDPAWGPRYFTPVLALLWLFAPRGAARIGRRATVTLLLLGGTVQLLALTVDPHRLYVERGMQSAFGAHAPLLYFDPQLAHLLQRPREIVEVWRARGETGQAFAPSAVPTFAFPVIDKVESGLIALKKYKLLNAFRPWWISHWYISEAQRPVPIVPTVFVLIGVLLAATAMLWKGTSGDGDAMTDESPLT